MQQGDNKLAEDCFQKSVDVTPRMAFNLIQILRQKNIEYIVAPYEADAQLCYLSINGYVDAVISEDSDLIPYGCLKIIYKLDKLGNGKEIVLSEIVAAKEIDLSRFSLEMLRHMCIISGCDYLESFPGMGIKKAYALVSKNNSMREVFKALNTSKFVVPPDYQQKFVQADLTFRHQIVYNPNLKKNTYLNPIEEDIDPSSIWFVGKLLDDKTAIAIANGIIDPHTHEPFLMNKISDKSDSTSPSETIFKSSDKLSASEIELHNSVTVRDTKKYIMQRGSRLSVSSLVSNLNDPSKKPNNLMNYFEKSPKQKTTNPQIDDPVIIKSPYTKICKISEKPDEKKVLIKSKYFSKIEKTIENKIENKIKENKIEQKSQEQNFIDLINYDRNTVFQTTEKTQHSLKSNYDVLKISDEEIYSKTQRPKRLSMPLSDKNIISIDDDDDDFNCENSSNINATNPWQNPSNIENVKSTINSNFDHLTMTDDKEWALKLAEKIDFSKYLLKPTRPRLKVEQIDLTKKFDLKSTKRPPNFQSLSEPKINKKIDIKLMLSPSPPSSPSKFKNHLPDKDLLFIHPSPEIFRKKTFVPDSDNEGELIEEIFY